MKHVQLFEEFNIDEGYFDLEDRDYVMYHATPSHNVEKIKKEGILPSAPSGREFSKGLVWMADTEEAAVKHASSRMKKRGDKDTISVLVLKMNPKKDKLRKSLTKGIYTAEKKVSPDRIEKVTSPSKTT